MKKLKRYQYERYAIICQLVYAGTFPEDHEILDPFGQRIVVDRHGRHLARILWSEHKKEVIVVFRGSVGLRDWIGNLCCIPVKHQTGNIDYRIHWGFKQLLQQPARMAETPNAPFLSLQSLIKQQLLPMLAQGKRFTFTGHSSGGCVAALIADEFERTQAKSVKRVVTFGQPAIGTLSFRRNYTLHKRTYRICCDFDIVTFMPIIPYFFWHVGRMLWLHDDQIYENTPTHIRFFKSLTSWLMRPITYHFMRKYIRNKTLFDEH